MNPVKEDMPEIQLTKAEKEDIKEIVKIWVETIDWHAKFDEDFTLDKDGKTNFSFMVSKALYEPTQVVFVAKSGNKVIGFLYGFTKKHSGFFKKRVIAHISDIAVDDDFRRLGIGSKLMEKFEKDFARENQADELTLYVHLLNESGVKFYEKLGYSVKLLSMRKKLEY
ncbi:MAG: putative N-acetyltransferase [Candidatus Heimdallarchaeota archaeon AB_125]|nr:MAG: putative N-acetyltransferase [Candidatus Heimdallarchaeota archaeon AB_125]